MFLKQFRRHCLLLLFGIVKVKEEYVINIFIDLHIDTFLILG